MRGKSKLIRVLLILSVVAIMLVTTAGTVLAGPPTTFTTDTFYQAQDQWRGSAPFGAWTYNYVDSAVDATFTLTGKTLHTEWSYSPLVSDLQGQSTVYTYDKKSGLWIEHEGQVSYVYVPGYGDSPVVNYFRGYVKFDGSPAPDTFVHGVAYQWAYIFLPEDAVLSGTYTPNAVWDTKVGAWLVGFSIYQWDATPGQTAQDFPDPFPEPVPANNYNPLDL